MNETLDELRAELSRFRSDYERHAEHCRRRYNKNFIVLQGPKEVDGDYICGEVCNLIKQKIDVDVSLSDLNACYRLGKKTTNASKPRPVAVQFLYRWRRDKVFSSKKR